MNKRSAQTIAERLLLDGAGIDEAAARMEAFLSACGTPARMSLHRIKRRRLRVTRNHARICRAIRRCFRSRASPSGALHRSSAWI